MGARSLRLVVQRVLDFESNADFFAIYVPESSLAFSSLVGIADDFKTFLPNYRNFVVSRQDEGDVNRFGGEQMKFSGIIYLYTENLFSTDEMADIRKRFKEDGVTVLFKNPGTIPADKGGVQ